MTQSLRKKQRIWRDSPLNRAFTGQKRHLPDDQQTTSNFFTSLTMKIPASLFLTCILIAIAITPLSAASINSTYVGPTDGNWGEASNWSPAIVPNNGSGNSFDVTVANVFLTLDLDVAVNSLTFNPGDGNPIITGGTAPFLYCPDQNFTSANTSLGSGGIVWADAESKDVTVDFGNLTDFSGTTLHTPYALVALAVPGYSATLKFQGANVVTSTAGIELIGAGTYVTDENGTDALMHFQHNAYDGYFDLEVGRNFTTEGSFVNEGLITIIANDPGFTMGDIDTTLTIGGNFTDIGYPLDPDTDGEVELVAPGPNGSARMVIKGALTNYQPNGRTLHKSYFLFEAANGASATVQVLGSKSFDVTTSEASIALFGPNTGFFDRSGHDALRHLMVSARLFVSDRDFTTGGPFTSTSRLSVFGDCNFTVNGPLTINNGLFEISPLTGYARDGAAGFPTDPYKSSQVLVRGNFNLPAPATLSFDIVDQQTTATLNVSGTAVIAGALRAGVEDVSQISSSDTFTVLTAGKIKGQFSNVANGGRVAVYGAFGSSGAPIGDPIGTFLVTYTKKSLTLSDFQQN